MIKYIYNVNGYGKKIVINLFINEEINKFEMTYYDKDHPITHHNVIILGDVSYKGFDENNKKTYILVINTIDDEYDHSNNTENEMKNTYILVAEFEHVWSFNNHDKENEHMLYGQREINIDVNDNINDNNYKNKLLNFFKINTTKTNNANKYDTLVTILNLNKYSLNKKIRSLEGDIRMKKID